MAPPPVSNKKVTAKTAEVYVLNTETRAIIDSIKAKDRRLQIVASLFFAVLFIIGLAGIYYQNHLAQANKEHIDCIVKLLATPSHPDQTRHISDLSTCQIKVSS